MAKIRQIGMAAGTFSVALAIGFVMQNGDALAARFGTDSAPETPAPFMAEVDVAVAPEVVVLASAPADEVAIVPQQSSLVADIPAIVMPEPPVETAVILPVSPEAPAPQDAPVQLANLDADTTPLAEPSMVDASVEPDCAPMMTAAPAAAAMVSLSVAAPCHAETTFVVHHQGMMFTATTDEAGNANLNVPALAAVAVMIAAFDDGNGAVASAVVPDFSSYDRAVLQWQGESAMMLSAYEGDADFGDANHIHAGNPGSMARLTSAEGGYLVRLGESSAVNPFMAEIYTYPSDMAPEGSEVMILAEAEITSGNCGRELSAQGIQVRTDGQTAALDLTMVMPECDAVGDVLILQNMFEDLTLASR